MDLAALVYLSLFLLALTIKFPPTLSMERAEQVADKNGRPIFPGGRFYIEPDALDEKGGGVRLEKTGNSKCPVTVLQDYSKSNHGMSVKFIIPGISPGIIFADITQLHIAFEDKPKCAESSFWEVFEEENDDDFPTKWIGIAGANDHSGRKTLKGRFSIHKDGVHLMRYKIVFCEKQKKLVQVELSWVQKWLGR
ncbi:hypothetical protein PIB30_038119 [Stylosanthes scabra]|uniref:Uncharacterized protein n=1 Tax=Stylosanthes scabra TaxID=79078 RepID=A0ABU6TDL8_9FABA|nr:hypothetical protein [Stylosanthes scabra]